MIFTFVKIRKDNLPMTSNYFGKLGRLSLCFLPLFSAFPATSQSSLKPAICWPPSAPPPTPVTPAVVPVSSVPANAINSNLAGTWGNGQHEDGAILQSLIDSNPYGTIYVPIGLYRLENTINTKAGLLFHNFHGRFVLQNGARLICANATQSAGQCVQIDNSSNATFDNMEVGYIDNDQLPHARNLATNNGILVSASTNLNFNHTTIEASTGSGIWVVNSNAIHFNGGTYVQNTTADGLHFENTGGSTVDGYVAGNTGDDALGVTNIAKTDPNCGLTATHLIINNSHSRGIGVAGACTFTASNFYIDMTANSGIGTEQDMTIDSRVPTDLHFNNGYVSRAGQYTSIISGSKDCIDMSHTTNSTVNGVHCSASQVDGVFLFENDNNISISNSTVLNAGNVGFQAGGVSNVTFTNDVALASTNEGFALQQVNGGNITGSTTCSTGGYGFYHSGSKSILEASLQTYDSGAANFNRAWWAENMTGSLDLKSIDVVDDEAHKTPIVVGVYNSPGAVISSVLPSMLAASLSVVR